MERHHLNSEVCCIQLGLVVGQKLRGIALTGELNKRPIID